MPKTNKNKKRSLMPDFLLARAYPRASNPPPRLTVQLDAVREALFKSNINENHQKKVENVLTIWESHLLKQTAILLVKNPQHSGIVLEALSKNNLVQAFVFTRSLLTKRAGKTIAIGSTLRQANLYKFFDCVCAKVEKDQAELVSSTNEAILNKAKRSTATVPEKRQPAKKAESNCAAG